MDDLKSLRTAADQAADAARQAQTDVRRAERAIAVAAELQTPADAADEFLHGKDLTTDQLKTIRRAALARDAMPELQRRALAAERASELALSEVGMAMRNRAEASAEAELRKAADSYQRTLEKIEAEYIAAGLCGYSACGPNHVHSEAQRDNARRVARALGISEGDPVRLRKLIAAAVMRFGGTVSDDDLDVWARKHGGGDQRRMGDEDRAYAGWWSAQERLQRKGCANPPRSAGPGLHQV